MSFNVHLFDLWLFWKFKHSGNYQWRKVYVCIYINKIFSEALVRDQGEIESSDSSVFLWALIYIFSQLKDLMLDICMGCASFLASQDCLSCWQRKGAHQGCIGNNCGWPKDISHCSGRLKILLQLDYEQKCSVFDSFATHSEFFHWGIFTACTKYQLQLWAAYFGCILITSQPVIMLGGNIFSDH